MTDGALIRDDGPLRLEFVRQIAQPRARVWKALTDPGERAVWFFAGTLDPTPGGVVDLRDSGDGIHGRVVDVVPGRRLEFTWDSADGAASRVRFELADHPDGCVLTFTHYLNPACHPENLLPGWHAILDDLPVHLSTGAAPAVPGRHTRLRERYLELLHARHSASTTIAAPPDRIFPMLTDPARHHRFDGSGMVGAPQASRRLTAAGQVFVMNMTYRSGDHVEHYLSDNHVTAVEEPRLIEWATGTHGGPLLGWRWRYDLEPVAGATRVTLTHDWSATPRENINRFGVPLIDASGLHASLKLLNEMCTRTN